MLEIIPDGMETRTLETVESEIILLRDQTARNMLEIGKRLIEAQGLCPKGQWKSWLSDNVQFSYRTAARMMAAYREFGADPGLSRLDSSKIYALLDAPEEMRAELRADPKALEDKSVRELQAEIKRRKQAEARIAELEAGLDAAMDKSEEEIEAARHEGRREAAAEIAQLETRLYESQAREQAARSALMDAQLIKPDTALAAENARLQSELLKAHDALNRAGARQPEPERKPERPIRFIDRDGNMLWTIRVDGRADAQALRASMERITELIIDVSQAESMR